MNIQSNLEVYLMAARMINRLARAILVVITAGYFPRPTSAQTNPPINPNAGLTLGPDGRFYGVTYNGGMGYGGLIRIEGLSAWPTALTLSSATNPASFGDPLIFNVAVTPNNNRGFVTLFDGTTPFTTNALVNGTVTIASPIDFVMTPNQHYITAVYTGLGNYAVSSNTLIQTVQVTTQPVEQLQTNYSGSTTWDPAGGILTFTSSGSIIFGNTNFNRSSIWNVPVGVNQIIIASNVTVTGQFTVTSNLTLFGRDRNSSILYGTPLQAWAQTRGVAPLPFSAVFSSAPAITVSNLTSLNPKGYHITGAWNSQINLFNCNLLDKRGGAANNSDGFAGGDGSLVRNCYFETGDDVIKVYAGTTCYDQITINITTNSVPIQLGYGAYGTGAVGNFTNLVVTNGLSQASQLGRWPNYDVINGGNAGVYAKTINIYGCNLQYPNATLVGLENAGQSLNLNITNAVINVGRFSTNVAGSSLAFTICGGTLATNNYNCPDLSH